MWFLGAVMLVGLLSAAMQSYSASHLRDLDLQLLRAANNGHDDEIVPLLDQGARVDAATVVGKRTPLSEALSNRGNDTQRLRIVETLLIRGANPNSTDMTGRMPLDWAVMAENLDVVKMLLAHGADPNVTVSNGSALKEALVRSPEIALALLAGGARASHCPTRAARRCSSWPKVWAVLPRSVWRCLAACWRRGPISLDETAMAKPP